MTISDEDLEARLRQWGESARSTAPDVELPDLQTRRRRRWPLALAAAAVVAGVATAAALVSSGAPSDNSSTGRPTPTANPRAVTSIAGITIHHPRSWRFIAEDALRWPPGVPVIVGYLTNEPSRPQCTHPTPASYVCKPPVAHLDRRGIYVILSAGQSLRATRPGPRARFYIDGYPATIIQSTTANLCPRGTTEATTATIYRSASETYSVIACLAKPTSRQRQSASKMIKTVHISP